MNENPLAKLGKLMTEELKIEMIVTKCKECNSSLILMGISKEGLIVICTECKQTFIKTIESVLEIVNEKRKHIN